MRSRRDVEVFSLSFLDCICCGFGAVILLLVIVKVYEPIVVEQKEVVLRAQIDAAKAEDEEAQAEGEKLSAEAGAGQRDLEAAKQRLQQLGDKLEKLNKQLAAAEKSVDRMDQEKGRLSTAAQELTEEMKRLQAKQHRRKLRDTVGGVPVDSEYIIFVIDTSGSMQQYSWGLVVQKVRETLEIYPRVKGIQVMNDMGKHMFSEYAGKWIPDSEARRKLILSRLEHWTPFSNSSPVEGITRAIKTYYSKSRKISIYVFGDEFSGPSTQDVLDTVDRLNKADATGARRVRIHAVGFPLGFHQAADKAFLETAQQFASLMRALCQRNGGTFVGLQTFQ